MAAAVCALASIVHLASYGPSGWYGTVEAASFGAFGLIFPIFGVAVVLVTFRHIQLDLLFGSLPTVAKIMGVCVGAYLFIDFFVMINLLPGQPIEQGGAFFLNNHGGLTPITEAAYRQDVMYAARLFSGHAVAFSGVAAFVSYQIDRVSRGVSIPTTVPKALPASPLPAPLSRALLLRTAFTPSACAERLQALIVPAVGSWSSRSMARRLAGSASSDGFWLTLPYGRGSGMVFAAGVFSTSDGVTFVNGVLSFKRWHLLGSFASVAIMLIAVLVAFHGAGGLFELLLVGSFMVIAVNLGLGYRDIARLRSTIGQALEATAAG